MYRRVLPVVVVALVTLAGCSVVSPTGAPLLTVENRDDTDYRLTVYVLLDSGSADNLTFRATNTVGANRSVGAAALRGNTSFRKVTLDADAAAVNRVAVRGGGNTTAAINTWDPGATMVYVMETADETASLAGVQVITCGSRDQEHRFTVAGGAITGRSLTCP
jgi:hypothetical protein